jgi:hypothetical protein
MIRICDVLCEDEISAVPRCKKLDHSYNEQ